MPIALDSGLCVLYLSSLLWPCVSLTKSYLKEKGVLLSLFFRFAFLQKHSKHIMILVVRQGVNSCMRLMGRGVTPLPHAPGARMVVVTQTSSHEPARQPASQASQPAIPPPSQPTSQPPSQPASQPATASQRRAPLRGSFQGSVPGVHSGAPIFVFGSNSDKFGKFLKTNSVSF